MENNTLDSEANKLVESPLRMQIKDAIKETCMDTTLHGIPHILDATNHVTLRIIWILATLTSFGACFYFVIQSILSYLQYPAFISVEKYNEVPAKFPMVSFCNLNTFNYPSSLVQTYLATYSSSFFLPSALFNSPYEGSTVGNILATNQVNQDPYKVITYVNKSYMECKSMIC